MTIGTISIPVGVGLILMMFLPLARVRYEDLRKIVAAKGLKTMLTISLALSWVVGPLLMFVLAWIFLADYPTFRSAIIIIIDLVVACIVVSFICPILAGGAAYGRTPRKIVAEALKLVDLKKDEVFYDLGCGTGEALMKASKLCDHLKGVEIEPIRWFIAKLRAGKAQVILETFSSKIFLRLMLYSYSNIEER